MSRERPTLAPCNGATIILVPNADKSLAVNLRTHDGRVYRIGYVNDPTPDHADAHLKVGTPAEVVSTIRNALAQRYGGGI